MSTTSALRRVDNVRSPDPLRKSQLVLHGVYRYDFRRPGNDRSIDRAQSHPPTPHNRHSTPRPHPGCPHRRPDSRGHATANQRLYFDWHILFHNHRRVLVDQHVLRKGRQVHRLVDHFVALVQARRLVTPPLETHPSAVHHLALDALVASAAEHRKAGNDPVSRLMVRHLGPDRRHRPRSLVSQDSRQRALVQPIYVVQVAVANSRSSRLYQYLSGPWLSHIHLFYGYGLVRRSHHGCFHLHLGCPP